MPFPFVKIANECIRHAPIFCIKPSGETLLFGVAQPLDSRAKVSRVRDVTGIECAVSRFVNQHRSITPQVPFWIISSLEAAVVHLTPPQWAIVKCE
jgi:hypothetical protein